MTPRAKELFDKLLRTRPKPDDQALMELFMAIQSTSINDLMRLIRGGVVKSVPQNAKALAEIEAEIKRQLRKVGGKAADFLPYLLDCISNAMPAGKTIPRSKSLTLSKALLLSESLIGDTTGAVVEKALSTYIAENDVSYRLKSA